MASSFIVNDRKYRLIMTTPIIALGANMLQSARLRFDLANAPSVPEQFMENAMWEVVLLTGLMIAASCMYLFVRMDQHLALLDKVLTSRWLYLAALFRLMLGAALIASASTVKATQTIEIIGWLIALGGLLLVAIPQSVWLKLSRTLVTLPGVYTRAYLLLGFGFGVFLVYLAFA